MFEKCFFNFFDYQHSFFKLPTFNLWLWVCRVGTLQYYTLLKTTSYLEDHTWEAQVMDGGQRSGS